MNTDQNKVRLSNHEIKLEDDLSYIQVMTKLGIVLYGHNAIQKVKQIIGKEGKDIDEIQLIRNDLHFWLIKPCGSEKGEKGEKDAKQSKQEMQDIERMVGLSSSIVCIDLSNQLEGFIEKSFCSAQNEVTSSAQAHKLIFIKDIYKDKQSVSNIKYFSSVERAIPLVKESSTFQTHLITISDLIQIYNCDKAGHVHKVKEMHEKYEQISHKQELTKHANWIIFDQSKSKGECINEIASMKLPSLVQSKLLWKLDQICRYRLWLEEEDSSTNQKYRKFAFDELDSRIGLSTILQYHRSWSENSLGKLKTMFNRMGNRPSASVSKQFQKEYQAMRENLEGIRQVLVEVPSQNIIQSKIDELDSFFEYHQLVLEQQSFGSLKFIKEEAKYVWKYRNNVYKKMAVFILLMCLAYFQETYTGSFVCLILAALAIALRS